MDFVQTANGPIIIWAIVLILFLVLEGMTMTTLVTIWFIPGTLVALLLAGLKAPAWAQIAAFLICSVISFIASVPLAKKINGNAKSTNYDRVIGKSCVVTEEVNNLKGTGKVTIDGKEWTARANIDGKIFKEGETAFVSYIEGVKVFLDKSEEIEIEE